MKENLKYLKIDIYLVICTLSYILASNQVVHINGYSEYSFPLQKSTFLETVVGEAELFWSRNSCICDSGALRWSKYSLVQEKVWGMIQRIGRNGSLCVLQEQESWEAGPPCGFYRVTIDFPPTNSRNIVYHSKAQWTLDPAFPLWILILLLVLGFMTSWEDSLICLSLTWWDFALCMLKSK